MNKNIYLKLRLERQHFTKPAGKKEYGVLFKQMSPVLCVYWSCPGSPPELLYRAAFDDRKYCYKMRGSRTIMEDSRTVISPTFMRTSWSCSRLSTGRTSLLRTQSWSSMNF